MSCTHKEDLPSWRAIEDTGAGDGLPTECERCGKPGTPRQQFTHMGVTICYICAAERVDELRMKGVWDYRFVPTYCRSTQKSRVSV